ncbi:uncharacterized protein TNCV_3696371 [Trichonephila clavipes]|nr:uncharacterized protein TNCV_3696371 [Trichonephila clavipes]
MIAVEATRGLLATDHVILNHGQVTWTHLSWHPPLPTTTPHQREDVSALDRFNVHLCPTRRVFSGTGLEPVTKQVTVRYPYNSATAATTPMGRMEVGELATLHNKVTCGKSTIVHRHIFRLRRVTTFMLHKPAVELDVVDLLP